MAQRALSIYMGQTAADRIARDGWQPALFSLLLGASGGPKWFILGQLDRFLFGDFLQGSDKELTTLGSSIGSWRNTCLALPDPAAAIARLEQGYLYQQYSERPDAEEISAASKSILAGMLGLDGDQAAVDNSRIRAHIVTARGRGVAGSQSTPLLAAAMTGAALGNALHRQLLPGAFQRVVFHSGDTPQAQLAFDDFQTRYVSLTSANLRPALHASGSIPFALTGERDISGAPPGHYWDGGIIDYHFDLTQFSGDDLILYPHFRAGITPGWFDKFLPWRTRALERQMIDQLVLMCPSDDFVASLPHGKIPDRNDFRRLGTDERIRYWEICVERSKALAEEFQALIEGGNPLAGVTVLGGNKLK